MSSDPFTMFDGAYVLGALSDADRRAFERHLLECDSCATSVRELRGLPEVLARVPESALTDEPPPLSLLPSLQRQARREARRKRWVISGLAAAAAACILAVAAVVLRPDSPPARHSVAMVAVTSAPITATADIRSVGWGTKIELVCKYNENAEPARPYALIVLDRSGIRHELGSWLVKAGKVTTYQSGISLTRAQIKEVDITTVGGMPLLALRL